MSTELFWNVEGWLLRLMILDLAVLGAIVIIQGFREARRRARVEGVEFLDYLNADAHLSEIAEAGNRAVIERWLRG